MNMQQRSFFDDEFQRDMKIKQAGSSIEEPTDSCRYSKSMSESDKSVADLIYARLLVGPATTSELVDIASHRFASGKNKLVDRGYIISVERMTDEPSQYLYTLLGKKEGVEVTDELKSLYYATTHWRQKRQERLAYDGHICARCHGTADVLEVHHWEYDLFNESRLDLMTFCMPCHEWVHSLKGVRCRFPPFISVDFAERIEHNT